MKNEQSFLKLYTEVTLPKNRWELHLIILEKEKLLFGGLCKYFDRREKSDLASITQLDLF